MSDAPPSDSQSQSSESSQPVVASDVAATTNGTHQGENGDPDAVEEGMFQLEVHLPVGHTPTTVFVGISSQEAIQDVRQAVIELPGTAKYSCFHLEFNGARLSDHSLISEVHGLSTDRKLKLVEDPYNEKEARMHVFRIRDIIGATSDRVDTVQGIMSGLCVHDSVTAAIISNSTDFQPMAGYEFEAPGVLSTLIPPAEEPAPKTVKSISVSPWNPPPYHLRQKGHLLYLQVTTSEGDQYQITSHVSGFYVNKSSTTKFDPFPRAASKSHKAHSLLTLLEDLSPSFKASFKKLQEFNNTKEPLALYQITHATPANPWIVPASSSPLLMHQSDVTRTQESYLLSGVESTETMRDWNEEFQSTRELPRETVQEKVFRDRLLAKLFADYTDAAARGAMLVARGEVGSLNPTEGKWAQIYVYNNIFYSFGADGVGTFASEGGDEAARVATGKDVLGVQLVNQMDIEGLFTPGTVVVDYLGKRIVGQSIVPGIFKQRDPDENQIDYGAVDGREVIAANEQFVPVFEKLSKNLRVKKHAVWDKNGKRFDLEGSMETKGLLGTDGRKYVLDLYRITPLDIAWMEEVGTALSSEKYGGNESPYPHRMTVLRPELVQAYWNLKMLELISQARKDEVAEQISKVSIEEAAKADSESATADVAVNSIPTDDTPTSKSAETRESSSTEVEKIADLSKFSFSLNPDVFSGQEPQTETEKSEWEQDEKNVRNACEYLRNAIIPRLIQNLQTGDLGFPVDGRSLTKTLHDYGINVRYLGKIAQLADEKKLQHLQVVVMQEMVSRGFKHVAAKYLKDVPITLATSSISHLLNCLLGTDFNSEPKALINADLSGVYTDADMSFQDVTPNSLIKEIEDQIFRRYRYKIEAGWSSKIKHVQLLREIALKLGLQLEVKDYQFIKAEPLPPVNGSAIKENEVNEHGKGGKKKKKQVRDGSPASVASTQTASSLTFSPDDILNITPVIKEASPRSVTAEEAFEIGKLSLQQNNKQLGKELLLESLNLHEQIYGIIHSSVASLYGSLAMLLYQLDEKDAAVELGRKSAMVAERIHGVDSTQALTAYFNLGLFCHANGEAKSALGYIRHGFELLKIVYGPGHPENIMNLNNVAVLLQGLGQHHESRLWFEACLKLSDETYGTNIINAATLRFQLAQALAIDQHEKEALTRMREAYNLFLNQRGPDDPNTKESENWLTQLTKNAVNIAKSKKAAEKTQLRLKQNGIKLTPQAQQLIGQSVGGKAGTMDQRKLEDLVKFIEGDRANTTKTKKTGPSNPKRRGGASSASK